MSDDGRTIDQRGLRTSGTRLRTYLPDELVARYEPIHNLSVSAGQADLVLARDRTSREDVVVKLYRNAEQLDHEVMERLYSADTAHVVRLVEHGESDGEPWEVQEYCALGTLTDYRLQQGGRLSETQARAAVKELADAIHHIHGLHITHRDLKPENILVRALDPLDLVLTDFGVAAEQIATVQLQTVAASWVWAAPEVHTKGAVSRDIDWWAMGAIVHQLLTGRHPLSSSDGRLPGDFKVIRAGVVDGLYSTETVAEERWRNLIDGLLSYEPTQRWGYEQVRAWLDGDDPEAVRTSPLAVQLRAARNAPPEETREHLLVWNGAAIRTGLELVEAMRADWRQASEFLDRWPDGPLRDWLLTRPEGQVLVQVMDLESNGAGRLIRLQARFDPDGPLQLMGQAVNDESVNKAIQAVKNWSPESAGQVGQAHVWLGAIRDQHVFKSIAGAVEADSGRLIKADELLDVWGMGARSFLLEAERVGLQQAEEAAFKAEGRFNELLGVQVAAALSGEIPGEYGDHAQAMAVKIRGTLDTLAKHELLPKPSPWAKGQPVRDALLTLALQVTSASREDLGLQIPASVYLELMETVCAHDLSDLRAQAERIRLEREARERAERERAEREARQAIERAEAEKKRLEEATRNARAGAAKWWAERLLIEQQALQAAEDERRGKATEALNQQIDKLTAERDRRKRDAGWTLGPADLAAVGVAGLVVLGVIWAVRTSNAEAALLWVLEFFPLSAIPVIWGGIIAAWAFAAVFAFGGGLLSWLGDTGKRTSIEKEYRQKRASLASNLKPSKTIRLVRIPVDKVGSVIGKGGETIKRITNAGVTVDIQGWHEVAPPKNSRYNYSSQSSSTGADSVVISKDEWKRRVASHRPWLRPRKASSDPYESVYKSAYWQYVDRDFLKEGSGHSRYGLNNYRPTDDDEWYSDETPYQDDRRFDDFGCWPGPNSGLGNRNLYDLWDWFDEPSALPPAPTPPTKTLRGAERREWKVAYAQAVDDYRRIRSEYQRVFSGPSRGHGGIVVAVVTAESSSAAQTAVDAIEAAMKGSGPERDSNAPESAARSPATMVAAQDRTIEVGQEFSGPVKNVTEYGAFVELAPGVDGLLHISQLKALNGNRRVEQVGEFLRPGQVVKVRVSQVKPGNKYSLELVL